MYYTHPAVAFGIDNSDGVTLRPLRCVAPGQLRRDVVANAVGIWRRLVRDSLRHQPAVLEGRRSQCEARRRTCRLVHDPQCRDRPARQEQNSRMTIDGQVYPSRKFRSVYLTVWSSKNASKSSCPWLKNASAHELFVCHARKYVKICGTCQIPQTHHICRNSWKIRSGQNATPLERELATPLL